MDRDTVLFLTFVVLVYAAFVLRRPSYDIATVDEAWNDPAAIRGTFDDEGAITASNVSDEADLTALKKGMEEKRSFPEARRSPYPQVRKDAQDRSRPLL